MATSLLKSCAGIQIGYKFLYPSVEAISVPARGNKHLNPPPRKRQPIWLPKQTRVKYNENVTTENARFIKEVVDSRYARPDIGTGIPKPSPLKVEPIEPQQEWMPGVRRTGVIAKKLGVYPMWLKNGTKVYTTLLQVLDNHVIKYIPPQEYKPIKYKRSQRSMVNATSKYGCLIVGAEGCDPQKFTKEYCGLFNNSGVMPKRVLTRFLISPAAALAPGTPLYAAHYKPGEIVDIRGLTIDRGFQGVCKRWGFKGGPASHGNTKTHRRPGNIGGGGEKGRVWPGTKMPGHMGNKTRIHRGAKPDHGLLKCTQKAGILELISYHHMQFERDLKAQTSCKVNSSCFIYDTLLPNRKNKSAPHFPTYLPTILEEQPLPEDMFCEELHPFTAPTIEYNTETE